MNTGVMDRMLVAPRGAAFQPRQHHPVDHHHHHATLLIVLLALALSARLRERISGILVLLLVAALMTAICSPTFSNQDQILTGRRDPGRRVAPLLLPLHVSFSAR